MLKNKWLTAITFTLLSLCAMMFAGCTLEDDVETLRERVAKGNEGNNNNSGNPFEGTWTGYVEGENARFVIGSSTWTLLWLEYGGGWSGYYTRSGNTATFFDGEGYIMGTATVSGNSLTLVIDELFYYTLTKSGRSLISRTPVTVPGTVQSDRGHAVYAENNSGTVTKRKETTAGPSVNLSFNGNNGTFSGVWDN